MALLTPRIRWIDMSSVMWFRRDLRVRDQPALRAALADGPATALFVVDPRLWERAGDPRRAWLAGTLRALDERLGGRLVVRYGDPVEVVPQVAREVEATTVHVVGRDHAVRRRRDAAVDDALATSTLQATGSPYAVGPGRVLNGSGGPYQVFTPFAKAWRAHGWVEPAPHAARPDLVALDSDERATAARRGGRHRPGGHADARRGRGMAPVAALPRRAARRLRHRSGPARPSTAPPACPPTSTSGCVHPRSLLADIADLRGRGAQTFETEIAWREFYADVLWHHPRSSWADLKPALSGMQYDEPAGRDRGLADRHHRLPDRRRRDAAAAARGLDAQPGADDHRQLPHQGPARVVAGRRPALPRPARRRRRRLQQPRLAVGGRAPAPTRRRTSASSTRSPRAPSSTPTATTSVAGSPSSTTCPARSRTSRGSPTAGLRDGLPGADRRSCRRAPRGIAGTSRTGPLG